MFDASPSDTRPSNTRPSNTRPSNTRPCDAGPCDAGPVALQQHPGFAAALRACGQSPLVLDTPVPLMVAQRRFRGAALGGFRVAMISRAGMPDPSALGDCLARAGLGRTPVILAPDNPDHGLARTGALPLMTPATVAEIDLRVPRNLRRAGLHQKWRNQLKRGEAEARRNSLRLGRQNLPPDPAHWLIQADLALQRQRHFRNWPVALILAYARENPGQAKLFTLFQGRDPLAAMLFLRHGTGATYIMGHTTLTGRRIRAHNLLLWRAANWLADKGCQRLDLGLLDTEAAPGLARFKLGAGAQARPLGGTWLWWSPMVRALRPLVHGQGKRRVVK